MEMILREQNRTDEVGRELYLAGERVAPGIYQDIDAHREIRLSYEDTLPASLDGHVACYTRVQRASDYSRR